MVATNGGGARMLILKTEETHRFFNAEFIDFLNSYPFTRRSYGKTNA